MSLVHRLHDLVRPPAPPLPPPPPGGTDADGWPLPNFWHKDPESGLKTYRYQAQVDVRKTHLQARDDQDKAARQFDTTIRQALFQAYIDVAKGEFDRARAAASFLQTASAAVGTAYTAILAFTFGTNAVQQRAFPAQGIISPLFLAIAIALATAYLAYLPNARDVAPDNGDTLDGPLAQELNRLLEWANQAVGTRAPALRAAVIAFGWGVATLPLAYLRDLPVYTVAGVRVQVGGVVETAVAGILLMVVLGWLPLVDILTRRRSPTPPDQANTIGAIWSAWQHGDPAPAILDRFGLTGAELRYAVETTIADMGRGGQSASFSEETLAPCTACARRTGYRYAPRTIDGRYLCAPCAVDAELQIAVH